MRTLTTLACLMLVAGNLRAEEKKVDHTVHAGYFESNKSGLKGDSSQLVITSEDKFKQTFGSAFIPGRKPVLVPKGAFAKKFVLAAIKRGNQLYDIKLDKLVEKDGTLIFSYTTKAQGKPGSARFAVPFIVSLDKGKYKKVDFVENGKKVDTIELK